MFVILPVSQLLRLFISSFIPEPKKLVFVPLISCKYFAFHTYLTCRSTTAREFARSLVQLQTFKQFVDGRLDMLNAGIGFRDDFENEVNMIDAAGGREGDTYKEWLNAAKVRPYVPANQSLSKNR